MADRDGLFRRFRFDSRTRTALCIWVLLFSLLPAMTAARFAADTPDFLMYVVYTSTPLIWILGFLSLVSSFICFAGCLIPALRWRAVQPFRVSFLVFSAIFLGGIVSTQVRAAGLNHIQERAVPLIAAISAYEKKEGHPPAELKNLVPDHLPAVPGTGWHSAGRYEYEVFKDKTDSPWELSIPCSSGMLNFDKFYYWPTKKYEVGMAGGWVERMGDWAYFHE